MAMLHISNGHYGLTCNLRWLAVSPFGLLGVPAARPPLRCPGFTPRGIVYYFLRAGDERLDWSLTQTWDLGEIETW